jgi:3-methyladenine DNA glycosylase AlkD
MLIFATLPNRDYYAIMENSIALELLSLILKHKSGDVVDSMFKRGIIYKINYGVNTPIIKKLVEPYYGNHELAEELYVMDYREAKLAAIYIETPENLSADLMERWSNDFINNEIVEQAVINLFWKSKYAPFKASEWSLSDNEYLQKAGLMIIGKIASEKPEIRNEIFEPYFDIIEGLSETQSPHTRSAAAFALREIGKRNKVLNGKAVKLADKLAKSDNFSAKWIAEEVAWILSDDSLQEKLG